jgi:hypothetical protein
MSTRPTLGKIRKQNGIAGQVAYSVHVTYPGEPTRLVTFIGSDYGGPVVMVQPDGRQTGVSDPGRHGSFGPAWVRSFFADRG